MANEGKFSPLCRNFHILIILLFLAYRKHSLIHSSLTLRGFSSLRLAQAKVAKPRGATSFSRKEASLSTRSFPLVLQIGEFPCVLPEYSTDGMVSPKLALEFAKSHS